MKILYLETSSKNCSVAIADGEELLCLCEEVSENYKQSENLHTFVKWALEGAEISINDLDAVCLGAGPGSYTGLRIGASAAKGFCFGLNIPLIAVNSLDSMVVPFVENHFDFIIPLVDARRMEVYTATYDGTTAERISETVSLILDENAFSDFSDKKVLFVGDGAAKAQKILKLLNAEYRPDVFPSAQFMLKKSNEKLLSNDFEDVAYYEPMYLKEFQGIKLSDKKRKN